MALKFLYLANAVLVTRVFLCYGDARIRFWKILLACLVQELATIVFLPGQEVNQLRIVIGSFNLFAWLIELFGERDAAGRRLIVLGLYIFSFAYFFSPNSSIHANPVFKGYIDRHQGSYLFAKFQDKIDWRKFNYYLFGALLCLNEANLFVRFVIENLSIRPIKPVATVPTPASPSSAASSSLSSSSSATPSAPTQNGADEKEYNRGRVIGYLERLIFFFFIIQGQFAALGFVISAKTIARFKDLDDRNFAEYFIIGTLLSVAIAGGIGLIVKFVCPL